MNIKKIVYYVIPAKAEIRKVSNILTLAFIFLLCANLSSCGIKRALTLPKNNGELPEQQQGKASVKPEIANQSNTSGNTYPVDPLRPNQ